MSMQTRADAIEALVKALERYQEHDKEGCPEGGCEEDDCVMCSAGKALASYRAAPKLTREQVRDAVLSAYRYRVGLKSKGNQIVDEITDRLLPLLEAAGAMEGHHVP